MMCGNVYAPDKSELLCVHRQVEAGVCMLTAEELSACVCARLCVFHCLLLHASLLKSRATSKSELFTVRVNVLYKQIIIVCVFLRLLWTSSVYTNGRDKKVVPTYPMCFVFFSTNLIFQESTRKGTER